ncbi:MAG: hypothetical protein LBQ40_07020 [Clostridiales bacterium]|jgi:hypothetical protein|nr:hypothetical protein [Clostridiales bacterium]
MQKKSVAYKERLASFKDKPDGTYDVDTKKVISYNEGFQVSFEQTDDDYTDGEYNAKVEEIKRLTGSIAHAGVFGGKPETSFHVKTKKQAMAIARQYNQYSIWDWADGNEVVNRDYDPTKGNKID